VIVHVEPALQFGTGLEETAVAEGVETVADGRTLIRRATATWRIVLRTRESKFVVAEVDRKLTILWLQIVLLQG